MKQRVLIILDWGWRIVAIAAVYTLALFIAGIVLGMLGLVEAVPEQQVEVGTVFQWTFVGGVVMAVMLGLAARQLAASVGRHMVIWSVLLFANIGSVIIEGYFFVPELVSNLWVSLAQQLLPCLITAILVYQLFAPRQAKDATVFVDTLHRPWHQWLWRYAASGATYLAAYWLFGAINFALVTRPYYEAQGSPLNVPDPQITLQAELIRAVLIVLSLMPFLLTAKMPIQRLAIWSGLLLFIVGGIVPLTWQAGTLPLVLLLTSAVEIFFQNFTTGVVAALLLAWPVAEPATIRLQHI